ncbi:unnamed protein product [Ranitomeya imitator]|uniref:Uncharacterized protein n=1 Tax=Ranitomeya imitator TaxID=111125 RepID=A0ABN9KNH5_9NEOB|nr:unnamed protein product [Ranitomeya imitator]
MPLKGIGFCKGCKGKPQRLANSKSIKFKAAPESTNAMTENDDNEQIRNFEIVYPRLKWRGNHARPSCGNWWRTINGPGEILGSPVYMAFLRKAHVKKEQETTKMWPENWGFLTAPYDEKRDRHGHKGGGTQNKIPDHMKVRTVTPLDQYIKVGLSPAIPQTTQGLIGWRSTISALQLERYGRTHHLKDDFCKNMNWPAEGIA